MKVANKKNICNQDEGIRIFFKHRQRLNEICCYINKHCLAYENTGEKLLFFENIWNIY